ncbi:ubiquitin-related modifier 1 [Plasmodium gonderi]|uniref:Ubiquitin-related modifier 1 homolog n=1 Tax=Plasmodium gonderi TaxID=77519 RepID=A0A1Y1JIX6_PLAGO|nr:ubiquitin-related modifier 1 [Plasmodium gonderi]GAW81147.1 ubiquitin-related modifier 1 [Plasmodium gonderi]
MKRKVELKFLGGLESYLENKEKNYVTLEIESEKFSFENLAAYIRNHILVERKDVFADYVVSDGADFCKVLLDKVERDNYNLNEKAKIKPGIIVLINEYDWEIMNTYEYKIKDDDKLCFLSTLHGG